MVIDGLDLIFVSVDTFNSMPKCTDRALVLTFQI